jgi:mRNA-degrading endonuclease RelE of RelBE toxin-antitoxin system
MTRILVMAKKAPFDLVFDPKVRGHLAAIEPKFYSLIRDTIDQQLRFEPEAETRNRKPLQQPAALAATWEVRFGPTNCFRVLYRVDADSHTVQVLAVGVKVGNRLLIGGAEVEL